MANGGGSLSIFLYTKDALDLISPLIVKCVCWFLQTLNVFYVLVMVKTIIFINYLVLVIYYFVYLFGYTNIKILKHY